MMTGVAGDIPNFSASLMRCDSNCEVVQTYRKRPRILEAGVSYA